MVLGQLAVAVHVGRRVTLVVQMDGGCGCQGLQELRGAPVYGPAKVTAQVRGRFISDSTGERRFMLMSQVRAGLW